MMVTPALHPRLRGLPKTTVCGLTVPVAVGLRSRLLGLSHIEPGAAGTGLLIPRCSSVHGFGMRFPLLVVFLDELGRPLCARPLAPPSLTAHRGAVAALEIPVRSGGIG